MTDEEDACISQTNNVYIKRESNAEISEKCIFSEETETMNDMMKYNDFDVEVKYENNTLLNDASTVFINLKTLRMTVHFMKKLKVLMMSKLNRIVAYMLKGKKLQLKIHCY